LKNDEYLRLGRESAAFYNAMYLDHDDGGVYFNVLASGLPYLMGTERMKGSHSMSGYHSFELAYLAAVYTNLLIAHQEMDFYFKPKPGGFKDGILRVQPDILPPGSAVIGDVWIDGERYDDFDAAALTVKLPPVDREIKVRVRLVPVVATRKCVITSDVADEVGKLSIAGILDKDSLSAFEDELQEVLAGQPKRLVLVASELESIDPVALRALIFALHKLGPEADVHLIGANPTVREAFANAEVEVLAADTVPAGT
jgi:anti-anti-sigma regulatory factor